MRLPSTNELDRRVHLQVASLAPSANGGLADSYTTAATVWAKVEQFAGGWYVAGRQQDEKKATHRVTARYRADWRDVAYVLHDGTVRLKVEDARELGRREFVEYLCNEERDDV